MPRVFYPREEQLEPGLKEVREKPMQDPFSALLFVGPAFSLGRCDHSKVPQALCHAQGFHRGFSIGRKHPGKAVPPLWGVTMLLWPSVTLFMG